MARARQIKEGEVYLPRKAGRSKFRRVVGIVEGVVCYSSGGDTLHYCSLKAFKRGTRPEPTKVALVDGNGRPQAVFDHGMALCKPQ